VYTIFSNERFIFFPSSLDGISCGYLVFCSDFLVLGLLPIILFFAPLFAFSTHLDVGQRGNLLPERILAEDGYHWQVGCGCCGGGGVVVLVVGGDADAT